MVPKAHPPGTRRANHALSRSGSYAVGAETVSEALTGGRKRGDVALQSGDGSTQTKFGAEVSVGVSWRAQPDTNKPIRSCARGRLDPRTLIVIMV